LCSINYAEHYEDLRGSGGLASLDAVE
jgi:hypothetical protein